jgi:glycosyltransferase involved in cell wall biosynthesis
MSAPDVSVVIPTFNRRALVGDSIESCLQEAVDLTIEVIVVDDGSTDGTVIDLARFGDRITLVSMPRNLGQVAARNTGLKRAHGEFIKFLDSDDVLQQGSLAREVAIARAEAADVVLSGWGIVALDAEGQTQTSSASIYDPPHLVEPLDGLLRGEGVPTSAALYRTDLVRGLRWDRRMRRIDDWKFFCEAVLLGGHIARNPATSYWMRSHAGQRVNSGPMVWISRDVLRVLYMLERFLCQTDALTPPRRRELAQYYYKEIFVLALHDPRRFHWVARHIRFLDPRFVPVREERRRWVRALSRFVGLERMVVVVTVLKRARNSVWRRLMLARQNPAPVGAAQLRSVAPSERRDGPQE